MTTMLGQTVDLVGQLAASHELTGRELRENARQQRELSEQLQETDRRLREWIGACRRYFERHLRDDHGGKPT